MKNRMSLMASCFVTLLATMTLGAQCDRKADLGDRDTGESEQDAMSEFDDATAEEDGSDTRQRVDAGPDTTDRGDTRSDTGTVESDVADTGPQQDSDGSSPSCDEGFNPDWEPNDSRASAHELPVGEGTATYPFSRTAVCPGDIDWYSLEEALKARKEDEVGKGDRLEAAITWSNQPRHGKTEEIPPNLKLELLHEDSDGSVEVVETATVKEIKNAKFGHWWSLAHEIDQSSNLKYYVRVTGVAVKHNYEIAVWRRSADGPEVPCEPDEYEPTSESNAASIASRAAGRLCENDVDVYKATIDAGERKEITATYSKTVDIHMQVEAKSSEVTVMEPSEGNPPTNPKDVMLVRTPSVTDGGQEEYTVYIGLGNTDYTFPVGAYELDIVDQ